MIQVIYEYPESWPAQGALRVDVQFTQEIAVSPEAARRAANSYLVTYVAMVLRAGQPGLVIGEPAVWRLPLDMHLRGIGYVATLGALDVDAQTGEVLPLSASQIQAIQERASDIIIRLTPEAEPAI
jgi:hypothetical protein